MSDAMLEKSLKDALHDFRDSTAPESTPPEKTELKAPSYCCESIHECADAGNCMFEMKQTNTLDALKMSPDETLVTDENTTGRTLRETYGHGHTHPEQTNQPPAPVTTIKEGWTRANYLGAECTKREYYKQFVCLEVAHLISRFLKQEGLDSAILPDEKYDSEFVAIPARTWDLAAVMLPQETREKLRELGDEYTLESAREILKETARGFFEGAFYIPKEKNKKKK